MKSKLLWPLVAVMFAGLVAMPAQAREGQAAGPAAEKKAGQAAEEREAVETKAPAFSDVDKDKSGDISKEEAKAVSGLEDQWTTLDTSKDGKLDESEFAAFEVKEKGGIKEKLKQWME